MSEKKNLPEGYLAVYRPMLSVQVLAFVVIVVAIVSFMYALNSLEETMPLFVAVPFVAVLGFILWTMGMFIARDKLIITEQGLLCWQYGFKKEASWSDLSHFIWKRQGKASSWGVAMHNGGFIPLNSYLQIPARDILHLQKNKHAFSKTEAGAYLYQYAPHLFE